MTNVFTAVWTALTSTNENLINILAIPCTFIEIIVTMLLFTTLLKIESSKKQKIIYVFSFTIFSILNNFIIPDPYKIILNLLISPVLVYFIFKTTLLKSILSEILPLIISFLLETIILRFYLLFLGINDLK